MSAIVLTQDTVIDPNGYRLTILDGPTVPEQTDEIIKRAFEILDDALVQALHARKTDEEERYRQAIQSLKACYPDYYQDTFSREGSSVHN